MSELDTVILFVAAFATSLLSGVLGMGGGITLLGVMTSILPAPAVVPLHGVVQLCSNFTRVTVFLRHVQWKIFVVFAPCALVGIAGATALWSGSKLTWFKPLIGVFLLAFLALRKWSPGLRNPPGWVYPPLGLLAGFVSIFVGATGPFLAPFFLRDDFDKEQVIATKAICQFVIHVLKIPAFLALGFAYGEHAGLLALLVVAVTAGTLTGKKLLSLIGQQIFVTLFVVLLTGLAGHLILSWFLALGP